MSVIYKVISNTKCSEVIVFYTHIEAVSFGMVEESECPGKKPEKLSHAKNCPEWDSDLGD